MTRPITTRPALMFARALIRRCPACGAGHWFRTWFRRVERCPGCGIKVERHEGFMLGAITINTVATFFLILLTIVVGLFLSYPDVEVWPILVAGMGIAVVFPLAFYPFSHTLWAAADLAMRPLDPGELRPPDDPSR